MTPDASYPRFLLTPRYWRTKAIQAGVRGVYICDTCKDTGMLPVPDGSGCIDYEPCMKCMDTWEPLPHETDPTPF